MDALDFGMPLLVVGIAGAAGIIIYLVSVFGIREKTFEEAIAAQKEISVELLGRKEEKMRKKNPVKQRKVKNKKEEKVTTAAVKEEKNHPHVEICPQPVILDENVPTRRPSISGLGGRRDSVKSILVNKSEVSPVGEGDDIAGVNHFEQIHPKDDCEMKKQVSVDDQLEDGEEEEVPAEAEVEEAAAPVVLEAPVKKANFVQVESAPLLPPAPVEQSSISTKKGSKKPKKAQVTDSELNATKLVSVIDKVTLSRDEIQNLIEYLLNRQIDAGVATEWVNKSKSDTTASLKKLLAEREKQLAEEQLTVETLQQKLKDLRGEFSVEKTRSNGMRKQLEDRNISLQQETQGLQHRIQQLNAVMGEKAGLERQIQELQRRAQVLHDENLGMKKVLSVEQNFRLKGEGLEREAEALRTQCSHLESQLKSSFQSNSDLAAQVRGLQEHSRGMEMKLVDFEHLQGFSSQLQERESHLINELKKLEGKLLESESEKNMVKEKLREAEAELRANKEEGERRVEESHQSEKNAKNLLQDTKSSLSVLEAQLMANVNELTHVLNEKEALALEVNELKKKASGDGHIEKRLAEVEESAAKLSTQNEELTVELKRSKAETETLKHKQQELVGKAVNLEEILRSKDKALEAKVKESQKEVETAEKKTKEAVLVSIQNQLQSLTRIQINMDSENWLEDFAKGVESQRTPSTPAPPATDEKSGEIERLTGEVEHYQEALKTTESLLRNLEGSIEKAEKDWKERVRLRDEEIESLKKSAVPNGSTADVAAELELQKQSNSKLLQRIHDLESRETNSNNSKEETPSIASVEELRAENEELRAELQRLSHTPHSEVANGNGTSPVTPTTPKSPSAISSPSSNDVGKGIASDDAVSPAPEVKKKKKGASAQK